MAAEQWVQSSSGYLELVAENGEVLAREKKRKEPRLFRGRNSGRPSHAALTEQALIERERPARLPCLYPFDENMAEDICIAIAAGAKLSALDTNAGYPPYKVLLGWRSQHPVFDVGIREAMTFRAEYFADKALEAVESVSCRDDVAAARLKFNAFVWSAAISDPSRFSKKARSTGHSAPAPVQITVVTGVPCADLKDTD